MRRGGPSRIVLSQNDALTCFVYNNGAIQVDSDFQTIVCRGKDLLRFSDETKQDDMDRALYFVYRHLFDDDEMQKSNIKYDITILLPDSHLSELPRTRGHYHRRVNNHRKPYFDIYQVLQGCGLVQMHARPSHESGVYIAEARPGDILFLPPELCHVVYNTSSTSLVFSNWCSRADHLDYETMRSTRGPAYRIYQCEKHHLVVKVNENFNNGVVSGLTFLKPLAPSRICCRMEVDSSFILDWRNEPRIVSLLNNPAEVGDWISEMYRQDNEMHYELIR